MKLLYTVAIATSVVLASITVPALQARADDDVQPPKPAWTRGFADGKKCVTDGPTVCTFKNPYNTTDNPGADPETLATDNSDYIAGFIAGKSAANK